MKKYHQFINEDHCKGEINNLLPIDFTFAIDIRNASVEGINLAFAEMEKYFIVENSTKYFLSKTKDNAGKVWAWRFKITNSFGESYLDCNIITTPGWGAGYKWIDDIITLKEFLSFGFEGIEDYIKMKNTMNQYNL